MQFDKLPEASSDTCVMICTISLYALHMIQNWFPSVHSYVPFTCYCPAQCISNLTERGVWLFTGKAIVWSVVLVPI